MSAADIARSLNGKPNGSGWTACCPAHNDRNPSLSIGNGDDGRPLVHCHAGCSQDEVIAVLRDRGDWPTNGDRLSTEREKFHYRIADGATLITVVRRDTPDGKRIHREPKGVKVPAGGYPLYRLGSILANHDKPLLVVEGEGTAETAAYLFGDRYEVTTAIGGAGKAGQTDWTPARSRDVVIWPDADEPWRKHADEVAKLCH